MPRVSVVIAAYNCASTIIATIDSVKRQTYSDWEIVVCDDCSTDDTLVLLRELAATVPIQVVENSQNVGPALTRNHALQHARGELVAILDSDDLLLPEYLSEMVQAYDQMPEETGIVVCDAYIEQDGKRLDGTYKEQFRSIQPLTLERLLQRNCIYISSLVPRNVGERVGWFSEELFGTEDFDLWVRILELGKIAFFVDKPLAVYRKIEGSVSSNIARMAINNQRVYRRALKRKKLTVRQKRIVYIELLYNKAMEVIAAAWFECKIFPAVIHLPTLLVVLLIHPHHWAEWARVLKGKKPS